MTIIFLFLISVLLLKLPFDPSKKFSSDDCDNDFLHWEWLIILELLIFPVYSCYFVITVCIKIVQNNLLVLFMILIAVYLESSLEVAAVPSKLSASVR